LPLGRKANTTFLFRQKSFAIDNPLSRPKKIAPPGKGGGGKGPDAFAGKGKRKRERTSRFRLIDE